VADVAISGRGHDRTGSRLFVTSAVASIAALLVSQTLVGAWTPAGAAPTSAPGAAATTQAARVAALEARIAAQQRRAAALDQRYDAAQARLATLQADVTHDAATLVVLRRRAAEAESKVRHDAIEAYIYATPVTMMSSEFAVPPAAASTRDEYQDQVVGNLAAAVRRDNREKRLVARTGARQRRQLHHATPPPAPNQRPPEANAGAVTTAQATLTRVQGREAAEVALEAAAQARRAAKAAAAAQARHDAQAEAAAAEQVAPAIMVAQTLGGPSAGEAAADAANQAAGESPSTGSSTAPAEPSSDTAPPTTTVPPQPQPQSQPQPQPQPAPTGSGGGAAVAAAESQLGVPYVYGGETPGVGFDCSGLTQWSWAQAGVSIPRTAAEQDASLPQVSLDALQPGDLLFYFNLDGDNMVDHVVMFVGDGPDGPDTVIQAPSTGSYVSYSPLWYSGLVGAAQP
jgi:peptidoglycan DL-endopeptidase CwlO